MTESAKGHKSKTYPASPKVQENVLCGRVRTLSMRGRASARGIPQTKTSAAVINRGGMEGMGIEGMLPLPVQLGNPSSKGLIEGTYRLAKLD
jgi:hypothetical protein